VRTSLPDRVSWIFLPTTSASLDFWSHPSTLMPGAPVFGPRVVAMYAACNAVEAHDIDAALRHAADVPPAHGGTLPATWEARYLLNMAYANSETGHDVAAIELLWQAKNTAPEWVTYHPLAATVVLEQLERPRKSSDKLAALATHLQVL
jgi:hypothetical protein